MLFLMLFISLNSIGPGSNEDFALKKPGFESLDVPTKVDNHGSYQLMASSSVSMVATGLGSIHWLTSFS